jgi:hypothetical protein
MEQERVIQKTWSIWKPLIIGFLLGVLLSFLALVIIAFKWGPQGENITVELYSGKTTLHKHFLWRRWQESKPTEPYVQWAIDRQEPVKSWELPGGSIARSEWFGDMLAVDVVIHMPTDCVYKIYSMEIPEEEKVELLHQYHQELDPLRQKDQKLREQLYPQLADDMKAFKEKWDQTLKAVDFRDSPEAKIQQEMEG